MRTFKTTLLLLTVFLLTVPAPAQAWFGWLDDLSGPGPFWGVEFDFRLVCFMEKAPWSESIAAMQVANTLLESVNRPESLRDRRGRNFRASLGSIRSQVLMVFPNAKRHQAALDLAAEVANMRDVFFPVTAPDAATFEAARRALDKVESSLREAAVPEVSKLPGSVVFARCSDRLPNEPSVSGYSGIRHEDRHPVVSIVLNYRELANTKFLHLFADNARASNSGYSGGKAIHLRILEPKLSWAMSGHFDFLDGQAGIGIYQFSSGGFTSFSGLVVEPIRFDLHPPGRLVDGEKNIWKRLPYSISYSAGVMLFPGGFASSRFSALGGLARDISGGEAIFEQGVVINVGRLFGL
jgi:hypothetical protein